MHGLDNFERSPPAGRAGLYKMEEAVLAGD